VMISVIIPALNSQDTIGRTLSSLFLNTISETECEIIVVDNGSSDNTVKIAQRYPAKILSCAKRGQGAARNLGLAEAKGEIICFTDSDVIVPKDWLQKISKFFADYPRADGVGGPVLPPPDGHLNNLQKLEGEIYVNTHNFPDKMIKSTFGDKSNALYSANCAYRKDVLLLKNCFDDSGFDAVDIDLCWKLLQNGRLLVFNPEIAVFHLGFPWSLKRVFNQQFRWGRSQTILEMRYPVKTDLKMRLLPHYYLLVMLLRIIYSRGADESFLQLFESCAFNFGYAYGKLKAYLRSN